MKRREFITLLGGAVAWPLAARAQQPAMPTVGFLGLGSPRPMGRLVAAFRQGLAKAGYVEGQNVAIEFRWADFSQSARLPALAAELVHRQVAVIFTGGFGGPAFAAKAATSTIPIVFAYGGDPVKGGLVASLSHPGGNVTGVTAINAELVSKWLSLAGDLVPQATTVGFLSGDSSYLAFYEDQKSQILAAARALGRQVIILETRSDLDYEAAFKTLVQREAGALIVGPFAFRNTNEILALAARYKIPTIYPRRSYVEAGGLNLRNLTFVQANGGRVPVFSRQRRCHGRTWAVASSVGENSRPSALAVLRLMTISNFVASMTGRSAGLAPARIRPV